MKHQLLALFCLSLLFAPSAQAWLPIVSDPLASYYQRLVSGHDESGVSVVQADFNCDGRSDVAITQSPQGSAGASWFIYLGRSDGRFTQLGSVDTKANRFHITKERNGLGRLAVMVRTATGGAVLTFYDVSQTTLRKVGNEYVRIPKEQTGRTRIDEVFGEGYSELAATSFTFTELRAKFPK